MAQEPTTVEPSQLEEGDVVTVHLNNRASRNLGVDSFVATVNHIRYGDVQFKPRDNIQDDCPTHTWYSDTGYIHGMHRNTGQYTDIGKVVTVTR